MDQEIKQVVNKPAGAEPSGGPARMCGIPETASIARIASSGRKRLPLSFVLSKIAQFGCRNPPILPKNLGVFAGV
jgi:hypothetical protein